MNGSALYYPNIDVRDPAWLRSALLYWDDIYTIVPRAIETPYETEDTKICAKEGQLHPLYCDDYPEVIKRLSERALELVKHLGSPLPITMQIGTAEPNLKELMAAYRSPTRVRLHPDKLGRSRLHPGKVSDELRYLFEQAEHGSSQWLLVELGLQRYLHGGLGSSLGRGEGRTVSGHEQRSRSWLGRICIARELVRGEGSPTEYANQPYDEKPSKSIRIRRCKT